MRVKTRILIGYGYLVALLLAAAVGASVGFFRLGTQLSEAIETGLVGVGPEIDLLEALELQHDLLVEAVLGGDEVQAVFDAAYVDFRSLVEELGATAGPAEREVLDEIAVESESFDTACDAFFDLEDRATQYRITVFPAYESLRTDVITLIDLSEERLAQTGHRLRTEARRRAIGHAVVVVVALLSLAFVSRALHRTVLDRLDELRRLALAIDRGDLNQRASVEHRDELGLVAEQINALLDEWQEAQGRAKGDVALQNQLLLGLVEAWPGSLAVTRLDGRLVASTFAADDEPLIEAAVRSNEARGKWLVENLVAPGGRPVGWLVTRKPSAFSDQFSALD